MNINDTCKVWAIINCYGDEGNWDFELYYRYEDAKDAFDEYVDEYRTSYPNAEWNFDTDYANYYEKPHYGYYNDIHYGTFWIEQVAIR